MDINLTGFGDVDCVSIEFGLSRGDAMWLFNADIILAFSALQPLLELGTVTATFDVGYGSMSFVIETASKSAAYGKSTLATKIQGRSLQRLHSEPYSDEVSFGVTSDTAIAGVLTAIKTAHGFAGNITYTGDSWTVKEGALNHTGGLNDLLSEIAAASACLVQPDIYSEDYTIAPYYPDSATAPYTDYTLHDAESDSVSYTVKAAPARAIVKGTVYPVTGTVTLTGATGGEIHLSSPYVYDATTATLVSKIPLVSADVRYGISFKLIKIGVLLYPGQVITYDDGTAKYKGVVSNWRFTRRYNAVSVSVDMEVYTVTASEVTLEYGEPMDITDPDENEETGESLADWVPTECYETDAVPLTLPLTVTGGLGTASIGVVESILPGGGTATMDNGSLVVDWVDSDEAAKVRLVLSDGYQAAQYFNLCLSGVPAGLSFYGDGYFSTYRSSSTTLYYEVVSHIYVPTGQGLTGLSWHWNQYEGAVTVEFPDAGDPPQLLASNGSGGLDKWGVRTRIAKAGGGTYKVGNYHFRFIVTDGVTTSTTACRDYNPNYANYDSSWNDPGYIPAYVDNGIFIAQSQVYNG